MLALSQGLTQVCCRSSFVDLSTGHLVRCLLGLPRPDFLLRLFACAYWLLDMHHQDIVRGFFGFVHQTIIAPRLLPLRFHWAGRTAHLSAVFGHSLPPMPPLDSYGFGLCGAVLLPHIGLPVITHLHTTFGTLSSPFLPILSAWDKYRTISHSLSGSLVWFPVSSFSPLSLFFHTSGHFSWDSRFSHFRHRFHLLVCAHKHLACHFLSPFSLSVLFCWTHGRTILTAHWTLSRFVP